MKIVLFIAFVLIQLVGTAQHLVYILKSNDQKTPIVGAKIVFFEGNNQKGIKISDFEGKFEVFNKTDSIQITAVGFDTLNLAIGSVSDSRELLMASSNLFDEVVVTAQYKPELANNAVQKIRVIPLEQIEQSGSNNLADILNYQAGIRISQDNILGSSMSLGGLSGQNVKILIDGVPVIGRQDGNIDLSQINLNNIERIEIVEGPLSVTYGTNALAGTINLITKKQQQKSLDLTINPYYESVGNYNVSGALGFRFKKQQFRLSGGRNYFDGWSAADPFFQFPKSRLADTNRFKTWKPKEQFFAELNYSTQIKNWQISPYLRYFDELIINRGWPTAPYFESGIDDYYKTQRADAGLSIQKSWKKSKLNSILAFNQFFRKKNTFIKDLTTLEQQLSASDGAQDTAKFSLLNWRTSYNAEVHKKVIIEFGLDLNYETAYGRRIEGAFKDQGEYAAYTTLEWQAFENFKVKPGLRYGYNTSYASPLTPSINLMYKWEKFNFRMAAARGFRAPTLKELYFDFVDINHNIQGNQDLNPEFSMNYSAGISWMKRIKQKQIIKVDYNFYYNDIENLITLGAIDNDLFTYVNVGEFRSIGNQIKVDIKSTRFTAGVNFALIGRYNRLTDENSNISPFSYSPDVGANASYGIIKNRLKVNLFYKYNGSLKTFGLNENQEVVQNEQSAYSILDASLSTSFFKKNLNVVVGAKNILNVKDVSVIGSTAGVHSGSGNLNAARGTSLFVSLKYKLSHELKKKK